MPKDDGYPQKLHLLRVNAQGAKTPDTNDRMSNKVGAVKRKDSMDMNELHMKSIAMCHLVVARVRASFDIDVRNAMI